MTVRQSPLPYLFILCALSSVIAQDASSQDTNTELDAKDLFSYLHEKRFIGSWQSTSSAQPFGIFEEHFGLVTSEPNKDCVAGFKVALIIEDGRYYGESLNVSLCHRFTSSFHFNSTNASFIETNIPLKVSGKGMTDKKCLSDVSIYFIDRIFEESRILVQYVISSSECEFSIITDMLTSSDHKWVYDKGQERVYIFWYSLLLVFEIIGFYRLIYLLYENPKISPVSYYWRQFWAVAIFIVNVRLYTGDRGDAESIIISIIPFIIGFIEIFSMCVFCCAGTTNIDEGETVGYSALLTICLLITWWFFSTPWAYFSSCLYLLPQIIRNSQSKEKLTFSDLLFLLVLMPPQLFYMGYFWMNPDNFARFRPNPVFFWTYLGFSVVQVIILVFQTIWKRSNSRYQVQVNEMVRVESPDSAQSAEAPKSAEA